MITAAQPQTLACGIHADLDEAVYHSLILASKTYLNELHRHSPMHARHAFEHHEDSEALKFGRQVHSLVLDGDEVFAKRFALAGQCEAVKKDGVQCPHPGKVLLGDRWFCGKHCGDGEPDDAREVVTFEDSQRIINIYAALHDHPMARQLIEESTAREISYIWDDAGTGVKCKARMDIQCRGLRTICDLKTCGDASREAFQRDIRTHGYDLQAAHYLAGAQAHHPGEFDTFAFICAEKEPPHGVAVYVIDEASVEVGHVKRRRALMRWAECMETGVWPGYSEQAEMVGLPEFEKRFFEGGSR